MFLLDVDVLFTKLTFSLVGTALRVFSILFSSHFLLHSGPYKYQWGWRESRASRPARFARPSRTPRTPRIHRAPGMLDTPHPHVTLWRNMHAEPYWTNTVNVSHSGISVLEVCEMLPEIQDHPYLICDVRQ